MEPASSANALLILVPIFILGLIQLMCLAMVIVKMFQNGETGMGIACLVLSFCTGIGALLAFVYGWVKSSQWRVQTVMLTWTACFVLNLVVIIAAVLMGVLSIPVNMHPVPG